MSFSPSDCILAGEGRVEREKGEEWGVRGNARCCDSVLKAMLDCLDWIDGVVFDCCLRVVWWLTYVKYSRGFFVRFFSIASFHSVFVSFLVDVHQSPSCLHLQTNDKWMHHKDTTPTPQPLSPPPIDISLTQRRFLIPYSSFFLLFTNSYP